MNVVILTGRLTDDLELRYTQQGTPCTTFNLAVDRATKEDNADFPTCVLWRDTAERACQYLHKGSKVVVRGELRTRSYEDAQTGKKHKVTEVQVDRWEFADSKPQGPFA
jgi:single-strand DNA-binding protein